MMLVADCECVLCVVNSSAPGNVERCPKCHTGITDTPNQHASVRWVSASLGTPESSA